MTSCPEPVVRYVLGICPLGALLVAGDAGGITALSMADDHDACAADLGTRIRAEPDPDHAQLGQWLDLVTAFLEHPVSAPVLPLAPVGTPFQRRVWSALQAIPVGTTTTYTELAASLGSPGSVRAVATACAANPIAVLIPCHRVVRADGALAGYRWGLDRKRVLLAREARAHPRPALQLQGSTSPGHNGGDDRPPGLLG